MQVIPVLTLREQAFFLLARRTSLDIIQQPATGEKDNLQKVFNKSSTNDRSFRNDTQTSDTTRQNPTVLSQKRIETHRNFKNLNQSTNKSFNLIDLSKKKQGVPQCELYFPSILYKVSNFGQQSNCLLQAQYDLPTIDQLNEWVIVLDSLLKDCFSICFDNSDQVLVEALSLQALASFLIQDDKEGAFKILNRITMTLQEAIIISPEIVCLVMMISGLWSDSSNEVDLIESERNYIASMISLMSIVGDPRGRGNSGLPIMMFFAWKLQILSHAGRKPQDSELAEELFDACLHGFVNYKRAFKSQTQQVVLAQEKAYKDTEKSQVVQAVSHLPGKLQLNEYSRQFFDLKHYKVRPKNVLTAGGFLKSSIKYQQANQSSTVVESEKQKIQSSLQKIKPHSTILHLQKPNEDADISDIELQIAADDDMSMICSSLQNQKDIETIPFPHWMINRQVFQQQLRSLAKESPTVQKEMLSQLVRETLNSLHPQALLAWLITYSPTQQASGLQWDSQTTKEFLFGQQNQMFSNSGSSAVFSQSSRSNSQRLLGSQINQLTQHRRHLGSYTQIFGKEVNGIQKSEMSGLVYIWGTDSCGQLGLDHFCPQQKQSMMMTAGQNLKLMHPRICIALKDEVIKEISCGYAFTFAVNHYGQTFCWGSNECGQLGLGQDSMSVPVFRSPQLNPYLGGISKLCAGNEHALALTKSGELYVWGSANLTGLGSKEHLPTPMILEQFSNNNVKQISCGGLHSMVLTKQGLVYTWGSNEGGQLGLDQKASESQDCVIKPTIVEALSRNKQYVIQIAGGETHSIALTREHKIWGWGMSMYGQLGLGFSADSFEPGIGLAKSKVLVPVEITPFLPPHVDIVQVFCGAAFTLMQTKDGELYGCGINDLGQLGLDTYIEDMQLALIDRTRVSHQAQMSSDVTVPSKVICFEKMNVQSVACGENHSLAVIGDEKNMLWSWGMYKHGQLGQGELAMKMNPRPIQTLCGGHIHSIAAGSQHSVALLGEQTQLNLLTHNFFLNTDILSNLWIMDYRLLDQRRKLNTSSKRQNKL